MEEQHVPPTGSTAQAGEDKTIAVISYLTLIGLIIAFVMNSNKKYPFASYHIRQSLGLTLCSIVLSMIGVIPILGWLVSIFGLFFLLYLWIMGIINALNQEAKPVPFLGEKFEEWFRDV